MTGDALRPPASLAAHKKRNTTALWLILPMALFAILFVGLPLLYVLVISFLHRGEVFGVTGPVTLDNYLRMFGDSMYQKVLTSSVLLALSTMVITLLIGYPFGYYMARTAPRRRNLLMLLVVVPFWTNALVRVYGWRILLLANGPINSLLQSIGLIDAPLKLLYNYGAVLLGMVYSLLPFMILPAYSAVEKVDWHCVEAARDLGSSPRRAFFTVTLPLTLPGIMAGCVLVFVPSMGIYFISDLLGGSNDMLIGSLIRDQLLKAREWPLGAALSMALMGMTTAILWIYRRLGGGDLGVF